MRWGTGGYLGNVDSYPRVGGVYKKHSRGLLTDFEFGAGIEREISKLSPGFSFPPGPPHEMLRLPTR